MYAEGRKSKESFGDYLIRMDAGFRELASEGIKLEDQVKGYVIFRHAALSQVQEDQVTTWTQGKFDREDIVKAIRKLEKVQKEKGGSRNFVTEEESYAEFEEQDEDSEDYVYVGERDLEEIMEEEEVQEALASYQQVRKAIKDQKTSRGYYDSRSSGGRGKGSGSGKGGKLSFSMGSGRIQFKGGGQSHGARVHIDMLKLRTRCAKCGVIGHWAKECTNEPDARAKQRQESMSGKTGFCEMGFSEEKGRAVHLFECFDSRQPLTLGSFLHRPVLRSPNSSAAIFMVSPPAQSMVWWTLQHKVVWLVGHHLKDLKLRSIELDSKFCTPTKLLMLGELGAALKYAGWQRFPLELGASMVWSKQR